MPLSTITPADTLIRNEAAPAAEASARREAERERRIARGRAEAAAAPLAVALAGTGGNGGPPTLSPLAELSAIAKLLYGPRWTTDVARDLGHGDGRTVRRWKSGEAAVAPADLAHLRRIARKRAAAITRLVGDRMDEPPKPKRDPAAIRAAFEATIAKARAAAPAEAYPAGHGRRPVYRRNSTPSCIRLPEGVRTRSVLYGTSAPPSA